MEYIIKDALIRRKTTKNRKKEDSMELSQLRYFQALANIRHFTQAAEACAISQSALSRAIAKLEDELHTPLFCRRAKGVDMTPAGEHFLYHVDRICGSLMQQRRKSSKRDKQIRRGRV
jgi:DNA-binding transcriptional LysR family regulator